MAADVIQLSLYRVTNTRNSQMSRRLPTTALAIAALGITTLHAQSTRAPVMDPNRCVPDESTAPTQKLPHPMLLAPGAAPVLRNGARPVGISGYYDYQSNGMMRGRFIANPANPQKLYFAAMRSASGSDEATVSANRRVAFAASSDGGATWIANEDVARGFRLGYPSLILLPDGTPLMACHGDPDGQGVRTLTYAGSDDAPTKEFVRLSEYPRVSVNRRSGEDGAGVIWPIWALDPANAQRTVLLATLSNLDGTGAAPIHVATADLGATVPWVELADSSLASSSGGRNPIAVSEGGKIGVAYYKNGGIEDAGIYFSETTDGGSTWSIPVKCLGFDYRDDSYAETDTISIGSNVDLVYLGEEPMVTAIGSRAGLFAAQKIMLWTPAGGARPIAGADSTRSIGLVTAAAIRTQPNMQYVSYPTISVGDDGRHVTVAFQAAAQASTDEPQVTSPEGFYYFRLWIVGSNDGGRTWGDPVMLQDFAGETTDSASLEYPIALDRCTIVGDKLVHRMMFSGRRYPGMYAYVVPDVSSDAGDQPAERGPFSETHFYFQETSIDTALMRAIPASAPERDASPIVGGIYPNPAGTTATLNLRLRGSGPLDVAIVDALGREIGSRLSASERHAGFYSIPLDVGSLAPGRYRVVARQGADVVSAPLHIVR